MASWLLNVYFTVSLRDHVLSKIVPFLCNSNMFIDSPAYVKK
ncbi:hypothetical protein NC652_004272 [Populus alba x Populus x berolinensis]|nr:hypothetical protein NC652_004272 [Populus alba x Populus x berolinensis]